MPKVLVYGQLPPQDNNDVNRLKVPAPPTGVMTYM